MTASGGEHHAARFKPNCYTRRLPAEEEAFAVPKGVNAPYTNRIGRVSRPRTRTQLPSQWRLRLSNPAASECVAGVWEPAAASRLRSRLLNLLNAARAHREHVWVAGFDEHRLHAFGERATALAAFGSMPRPGGLPLGWVPAAPPDPLWTGEDCSVCMETFSSPWPARDARSRAPPYRWH